MDTEIYYFSGTGNSLFIARELQKRLGNTELLPIAGLMDRETVRARAKAVGFVFPVHALTIPLVVKRFLKKIDLGAAEYLFAVATRLGTVFRGFEKMDRLLKRQRKRLNARFIVTMGNNEARHEGYIVPSKEDIAAMEAAARAKLDRITAVVQAGSDCLKKDTEHTVASGSGPVSGFVTEILVLAGMAVADRIGGVQYFYADAGCTGCGICEKVCLSRKIVMRENRPFWQRDVFCYMCFACLNFCPRRAVQIKDIPGVPSFTRENGRYPHPYATADDISAQKAAPS